MPSIRLASRGERSAAADLAAARCRRAAPWRCWRAAALQRIRLPGRADPAERRLPRGPGARRCRCRRRGAATAARPRRPRWTRRGGSDAALDLGEAALLLEGFCAAAAHAALGRPRRRRPPCRRDARARAARGPGRGRPRRAEPGRACARCRAPDLPPARRDLAPGAAGTARPGARPRLGRRWRRSALPQALLGGRRSPAAALVAGPPPAVPARPGSAAVLAEAVAAFAAAWPRGPAAAGAGGRRRPRPADRAAGRARSPPPGAACPPHRGRPARPRRRPASPAAAAGLDSPPPPGTRWARSRRRWPPTW